MSSVLARLILLMKVLNKSAGFDYELFERIECGIVLNGGEAKSVRKGNVKMDGAHARIVGGELFLINCQIYPYEYSEIKELADRTRKLLIHKKEIISLEQRMKTGRFTLVPTAIYTKGPRVKVELALARGKRKYEKREAIKKKDEARDAERSLREK